MTEPVTGQAGTALKAFHGLIFYFCKLHITQNYHFNHFKVYNLVALSTFMMLCAHHRNPVPELFHHPKETPCAQLLPFPPPPASDNHQTPLCGYGFAFAGHFVYTWGLLCLASCPQRNVCKERPLLNHESAPHSFSVTEGHSRGCDMCVSTRLLSDIRLVGPLAVVSSAAMNACVQVSLTTPAFSSLGETHFNSSGPHNYLFIV